MKRMLCFILAALLFCASCTPALAASLPSKASQAIKNAGWEGYKAVTVLTYGKSSPPLLVFALMRKGNQNLLCALMYNSQAEEYELQAANEHILPSGKITPKLFYGGEAGEFHIEYSVKKPTTGQPAKVVLIFSYDWESFSLQSAEFTYPAGKDRLFPRDDFFTAGSTLYITRSKVDKRGEYIESGSTCSLQRADWVYELSSFSLEQALADIEFALTERGRNLLHLSCRSRLTRV